MSSLGTYQEGYADGMAHMAKQVQFIERQLLGLTKLLSKAVIFQPANLKPRPATDLWLVLDSGVITTGFFLNNQYIADSGLVVTPAYWGMVPTAIKGIGHDSTDIAIDPKSLQ